MKIKTPKYEGYEKARIVKRDHEKIPIVDFLLAQIYKVYLLLDSGSWIDAFIQIYNVLIVINYFNDFVIYIRASFLLVLILQKLELHDKAFELIAFVRDLVEETNNYQEAILVYEQFGKMYQRKKQYQVALMAFKKML